MLLSASSVLREQRLTGSAASGQGQASSPPSPSLLSSLWQLMAGASTPPTSATPQPPPSASGWPSRSAWPSRLPSQAGQRVVRTRRSTRSGTPTGSATHSCGASPSASVPPSWTPGGTPPPSPSGSHTPSAPGARPVTPSALASHATLAGVDPFRDWADLAAPEWRVQPPLDAWTLRRHARVPPPQSVGFSAADPIPTAYILTGNVTGPRYRHTAVRAAAVGFRPVPHVGRWPAGDTLRTPAMQRFCATRYAHTDAWQRFVDDPTTGEGDYAFFFEDDVSVTPPAWPDAVHTGWRRALSLEAVSRRGVLYLGGCGALLYVLGAVDWLRAPVPPVPPGDGIDDGLAGAPRAVLDGVVRAWLAEQTARDEADWRHTLAAHNLTARPSPPGSPSAWPSAVGGGEGLGDDGTSGDDGRRRRRLFINESYSEITTGPFWLGEGTFMHRMVRVSPPPPPPDGAPEPPEEVEDEGEARRRRPDGSPRPSRSPRPLEREVLQLGVLTLPRCAACMHAYGLRKDVARHLARRMQQLTPRMDDACDFRRAIRRGVDPRHPGEVVNADTALLKVCRDDWLGMPLLGFNLAAPGDESHTGVFYQDRLSFGSSLVANNYGVAARPTVRREPWETDADFARRRRQRRRRQQRRRLRQEQRQPRG